MTANKTLSRRIGSIRRNEYMTLYLFLLPALVFLIIFSYIPMGGLVIAFQDFNVFKGIGGSPFVGMANFEKAFSDPFFLRALRNTVFINTYKLLYWIPLPLIMAIMINELHFMPFRKTVQTIVYMPHFLSWVIVGGIFTQLLTVNGGAVNKILAAFGIQPVRFLTDANWFRETLIWSSMWKEAGWGTIVYLAAITAVDPSLYEAATIDGASKWLRIWKITIPSVANTVAIVLMLSLGNLLGNSFEQILVMYNSIVYETADVIGTYTYRIGIGQMQYSYSAAIGMFNSVVGFTLVVSMNALCRKFLDRSIW